MWAVMMVVMVVMVVSPLAVLGGNLASTPLVISGVPIGWVFVPLALKWSWMWMEVVVDEEEYHEGELYFYQDPRGEWCLGSNGTAIVRAPDGGDKPPTRGWADVYDGSRYGKDEGEPLPYMRVWAAPGGLPTHQFLEQWGREEVVDTKDQGL